MRRHHPCTARPAAAMLVTAALAACSPDPGEGAAGEGGPRASDSAETADRGAATGHVEGPRSSSSSSPSVSPLPPVVPVTPHAPTHGAVPPAAPVDGPLIASATWADSDYGTTLKIAPTDAARTASGPTDARTAWREVLALAPDADTPGMWEQFDCHWTWARILEPDKPTWNVEPWRPVVDEAGMLADGCNPGGPEV